jgi:hypothetical protein
MLCNRRFRVGEAPFARHLQHRDIDVDIGRSSGDL